MEFKFNVSEIFPTPIIEINQSLVPPGYVGDRRGLCNTVTKVAEIVNAMGDASAVAQGLTKPITTADRLRKNEQTIYLLVDRNAKSGKGVVTGMLKTGKKSLYVFDRDGQHYHVAPPCVLDFYVHESRQRTGLGKQLFQHMLMKEQVEPIKLAIDRPSDKLLSFLNKHYGLNNAMRQMNNYVVFDGFFPEANKNLNGDYTSSNGSPNQTKQSANGLQSFGAPLGRYGAPRPPCSMGQIIHNQSPVQSNEGSGANVNPQTSGNVTQQSNVPQYQQPFSPPQMHVYQNAPNVPFQQPQQQQYVQYYQQPNMMQQQSQPYIQQQYAQQLSKTPYIQQYAHNVNNEILPQSPNITQDRSDTFFIDSYQTNVTRTQPQYVPEIHHTATQPQFISTSQQFQIPQPQLQPQPQSIITPVATTPQQFVPPQNQPISGIMVQQPLRGQQSMIFPQAAQQNLQPIQQHSAPVLQQAYTNAQTPQYQQFTQPPNTEQPMLIKSNQNYTQPYNSTPPANAPTNAVQNNQPAHQYQYYNSAAQAMQTDYKQPYYSPQEIKSVPATHVPNASGDMMQSMQNSSEIYGQQAATNIINSPIGQQIGSIPSTQAPQHQMGDYQQMQSSTPTQDQSGQMSVQNMQLQGQPTKGEFRKSFEDAISQSPKLERPRSLSIQRSEDSENVDKILGDIKNEVHPEEFVKIAEDDLDNIENDIEKVLHIDAADSSANNENGDDTESRCKSPNPLTAQGFFDLKFYHSRLW